MRPACTHSPRVCYALRRPCTGHMMRPETAWALLAVLFALAGSAAAAEARARSGSEFLDLLRDATQNGCAGHAGEAAVELASGVGVGQAMVDSLGLALPLSVPSNCTLRLLGGGPARAYGCLTWAHLAGRRSDSKVPSAVR